MLCARCGLLVVERGRRLCANCIRPRTPVAQIWWPHLKQPKRCGEIYVDMQLLNEWDSDIKIMDTDRSGARFKYPPFLFALAFCLEGYFMMSYRDIAKLLRSKFSSIFPDVPDFTTISRRRRRAPWRAYDKNLGDAILIKLEKTGIRTANLEDVEINDFLQGGSHLVLKICVSFHYRRGRVESASVANSSMKHYETA